MFTDAENRKLIETFFEGLDKVVQQDSDNPKAQASINKIKARIPILRRFAELDPDMFAKLLASGLLKLEREGII